MINKIIFFITSPFNQRDYKRFGIEVLQSNGFDVEVWNFTPFLKPDVWENVKVPDPINWDKCISFSSLSDAKSIASNITSNTFIVCMIDYSFETFSVYKILSRNKLPYCVFMANAFLLFNNGKKMSDLLHRIGNATFDKIIANLFIRIPYKWLGVRPATLILAGGSASTSYKYPIDKKTETLWLHTLDYDIYLNELKNKVEIDDKLVVFLDEYLPFHPDLIHCGLSVPATSEEYYPNLCKFFDFIENKYNIHVVIAAHPRSKYEEHPDCFGGRPVIKGKTIELVRKSKIIVSHCSTAINFAVLFNKPIIFITSDRLKHSWMRNCIESMASMFGKKSFNLDNIQLFDIKNEMLINDAAYKDYKQSYIKKDDSEDLPFWQILSNYINKKYNLRVFDNITHK